MGRKACTEPQCLYSTAISLLPLWTVRLVQSLSACTGVHLSFYLFTYMLRQILWPSSGWKVQEYKYIYCVSVEWSRHTINIFVLLHFPPRRWPQERSKHVGGHYIVELHPQNPRAFVGLCTKSIFFFVLIEVSPAEADLRKLQEITLKTGLVIDVKHNVRPQKFAVFSAPLGESVLRSTRKTTNKRVAEGQLLRTSNSFTEMCLVLAQVQALWSFTPIHTGCSIVNMNKSNKMQQYKNTLFMPDGMQFTIEEHPLHVDSRHTMKNCRFPEPPGELWSGKEATLFIGPFTQRIKVGMKETDCSHAHHYDIRFQTRRCNFVFPFLCLLFHAS